MKLNKTCWKDPRKEIPEEGRIVAVINKHFKRDTHLNISIHFGIVEYGNDSVVYASENDEMGSGDITWQITPVEWPSSIYAWSYAEEINIPKWKLK